MSTINVAVVTGGHPFDATAFEAMLASFKDLTCTWVAHPAAQALLHPERSPETDVVLFYDMCGIPEAGASHDRADDQGHPPAAYVDTLNALIAKGTGMMMLNHATVSWPHWDRWRALTGSPFMLTAGTLGGVERPGSGYRGAHGPLPNATVSLSPASDHPVLAGLPETFPITDELYLKTAEFEDQVTPLLRADYAFVRENFSPPPLASAEEQATWQHPEGSNLLAWATALEGTPVVVSELGDGPLAYENEAFRQFVGNSLRWLGTEVAPSWAKAQSAS